MTRAEAVELLEKNEVAQITNSSCTKLKEEFDIQKKEWSKKFQHAFWEACEAIVAQQKEGTLKAIQYITITILRNQLEKDIFELPIYVSDERWWLDPKLKKIGSYDASDIFKYFKEIKQQIEQARKRYIGRTIPQDTTIFCEAQVDKFMTYIAKVVKQEILETIDASVFQEIKAKDKLAIYVGEYFDKAEWIYEERKIERTEKEWKQVLEELKNKKQEKICFQDLRESSFSYQDFSGSDFRFTNFRKSILKYTNFRSSLLNGAIFRESQLSGALFRGCMLSEANFDLCDLRGCDFRKSEATEGYEYGVDWFNPYGPVTFRGANLSYADFRRSKLEVVDFTDAYMKDTQIDKSQWEKFPLSEEQRKQVKVVDEWSILF